MSDAAAFFAKKNNTNKFNGFNANRIDVSQVSFLHHVTAVIVLYITALRLQYTQQLLGHTTWIWKSSQLHSFSYPDCASLIYIERWQAKFFICQNQFDPIFTFTHSLFLQIVIARVVELRVPKWTLQQRQSPHINVTYVMQVLSSGNQWSCTQHPHIILHPKEDGTMVLSCSRQ